MQSPALSVKNISKRFGNLTALDSVNLDVQVGETFGLLGPNGAGKSTLINIICGVLSFDSGSLEFFGVERKEPTIEFKMSMGVIPQEISLYDKLSARENMEFYGRLYDLSGAVLKSKIDETLELVGLTDRQNGRISTFSGGMKRRINIACSILHSPKFILMDEPTVGIDPQSRNLIFEVIEKLHEEGVTIVYTSHYMEEVERLCQNITIIDHGKVIANGTKPELIGLIGELDTIEIEFEKEDIAADAGLLEQFKAMEPSFTDGVLSLKAQNGSDKLGAIINQLTEKGREVKRVHVREPNLENVFLHLTGKELRD
ncbi:MAG: ABC transporter ATP-binding protein [bacterium]|nr:ABC transporter ATP-binding protein [bacterium]